MAGFIENCGQRGRSCRRHNEMTHVCGYRCQKVHDDGTLYTGDLDDARRSVQLNPVATVSVLRFGL